MVFGQQSAVIERWASTSAKSLGISRQAALEQAGTFGNLFRALDIVPEAAARMSTSIVGLAGDIASFNNVDAAEVLLALRSGLVGEVEPLRRFGVSLSQARIEAEAVASGIVKATGATEAIARAQVNAQKAAAGVTEALKKHGEGSLGYRDAQVKAAEAEAKLAAAMKGKVPDLTAAQKAQAAYSVIMKDTALAQGDFARTSGGLANQQRILAAQFTDLKARIGQGLLPVAVAVTKTLNDRLLPAFGRLQKALSGPLRQAAYAARLAVEALATGFKGGRFFTDGSRALGLFLGIGKAAKAVQKGLGEFFYSLRTGFSQQDVRTGPENLGLILNRVGRVVAELAREFSDFATRTLLPFAQRFGRPVAAVLKSVADAVFRFVDFLSSPEGERARQVLLGLVGAVAALKVAEDVAGRVNKLVDGVKGIKGAIDGALPELKKLKERVDLLKDKTVKVAVDGAQAARDAAKSVADELAKIASKAVDVSVKAKVDATDAAKKGADFAANFVGGFLGGIGGLIAGLAGPAIVAALGGVSATVAVVVGAVLAAALAAVLAFVFRKQIARFFTETLPDALRAGFREAAPRVERFVTETIPRAVAKGLAAAAGVLERFFTQTVPRTVLQTLPKALGRSLGLALGLGLVGAVRAVQGAGVVLVAVRQAGEAVGRLIAEGVRAQLRTGLEAVESLFTEVLPRALRAGAGVVARFFTETLPRAAVAGLGVLERFFTESVPRFVTDTLPEALRNAADKIKGFFRDLPDIAFGEGGVLDFIVNLPDLAAESFAKLPKIVIEALDDVLEAIGRLSVVEALGKVFGSIADGFRDGWRKANEITGGALDDIASAVGSVPGRIAGAVGDVLSAARSLGSAIVDGIADGVRGAAGFAGDIAKGIANAVIATVNEQVIDRVNRALEFSIPVPFGPDVKLNAPDIPRIPSLAAGGIVPARPGVGLLARLGEGARAEAVIPLPPGLVPALERIAAGAGDSGARIAVYESHSPYETGIEVARRMRAEAWVGR